LLILEPTSRSGYLAAARLRVARPDLPIICISTESPSRTVQELGPVAYFVNPVAIAEIEQAVANALLYRG
jgi:DNA-binding NarL/FixJ family response regulator